MWTNEEILNAEFELWKADYEEAKRLACEEEKQEEQRRQTQLYAKLTRENSL